MYEGIYKSIEKRSQKLRKDTGKVIWMESCKSCSTPSLKRYWTGVDETKLVRRSRQTNMTSFETQISQ